MQNSKSPYSIEQGSKPVLDMDPSSQYGVYADEEAKSKAPPAIAFPLDTLNQFIGNMLICLTQVRSQLNIASEMPVADKKMIGKIMGKIDKINMIAISIPEDLDSIQL